MSVDVENRKVVSSHFHTYSKYNSTCVCKRLCMRERKHVYMYPKAFLLAHLTDPITPNSVVRNNEKFLFGDKSASEIFIHDITWEETIGDLRKYIMKIKVRFEHTDDNVHVIIWTVFCLWLYKISLAYLILSLPRTWKQSLFYGTLTLFKVEQHREHYIWVHSYSYCFMHFPGDRHREKVLWESLTLMLHLRVYYTSISSAQLQIYFFYRKKLILQFLANILRLTVRCLCQQQM